MGQGWRSLLLTPFPSDVCSDIIFQRTQSWGLCRKSISTPTPPYLAVLIILQYFFQVVFVCLPSLDRKFRVRLCGMLDSPRYGGRGWGAAGSMSVLGTRVHDYCCFSRELCFSGSHVGLCRRLLLLPSCVVWLIFWRDLTAFLPDCSPHNVPAFGHWTSTCHTEALELSCEPFSTSRKRVEWSNIGFDVDGLSVILQATQTALWRESQLRFKDLKCIKMFHSQNCSTFSVAFHLRSVVHLWVVTLLLLLNTKENSSFFTDLCVSSCSSLSPEITMYLLIFMCVVSWWTGSLKTFTHILNMPFKNLSFLNASNWPLFK